MMKVSRRGLSEVEHNISPPMDLAITIPIGGFSGPVVYVGTSPFGDGSALTEPELIQLATKIADFLETI